VCFYTKASVCGRAIAEIAGSSPVEVVDVRLLCLFCVVSLRRADHSFRGFPLDVCDVETSAVRRVSPDLGCRAGEKREYKIHRKYIKKQ
jgi:hypothetical protein